MNMADAKDTKDVPEQLKQGFRAGTGARAETKKLGANAKYIAGAVVGIVLLIGAITIFIPYIREKVADTETTTPTGAKVTAVTSANWDTPTADGSLPVGVWSKWQSITPGCGVRFDDGNGTVYEVESSLYGSAPATLKPGTFPNADQVRYKMLKSGIRRVPVRMVCS